MAKPSKPSLPSTTGVFFGGRGECGPTVRSCWTLLAGGYVLLPVLRLPP